MQYKPTAPSPAISALGLPGLRRAAFGRAPSGPSPPSPRAPPGVLGKWDHSLRFPGRVLVPAAPGSCGVGLRAQEDTQDLEAERAEQDLEAELTLKAAPPLQSSIRDAGPRKQWVPGQVSEEASRGPGLPSALRPTGPWLPSLSPKGNLVPL